MLDFRFLLTLVWAIGLNLVTASSPSSSNNLQLRGTSESLPLDPRLALRRGLSSISKRDTVFKNSTSFDKSWDGAVLFEFNAQGGNAHINASSNIEIVCTTCYIKGTATAQLTVDGNFNISQAFQNVTAQVKNDFDNITTTAEDYIKNYTSTVFTNIEENGLHLDDFDLPPIDIDFDLDLPTLPESQLQFQFDGMEIFVQLDTVLSSSATYSLNLYTSETPIGVGSSKGGNDLLVGVVFALDLIMSVDAEIDISSGFHLQLNDGIVVNIPMFDKNVSSITFNGGHFEFLPVKIQSAGAVMTALLRLGVKAGVDVGVSESIGVLNLDLSSGLEGGIWTDLAQFTTNVTAAPENSTCELRIVEEYTLLLGANAGATVAVQDLTWGPTASSQIPIFFTTLATACATSKSAANATTTATPIAARADLTTSTISTEITYAATLCLSTGLINCPASLQSTTKNTVTKTLVTAVSSGVQATFPNTTQSSVTSTVAFGTNAQKLSATSGSPVSFVPAPSATNGTSSFIEKKTGGVSNGVIIGASVGGAVLGLIAILSGCLVRRNRKRHALIKSTYVTQERFQPQGSYQNRPLLPNKKKSGRVNVVEVR